MLYLIGLGLNRDGISQFGLEVVKRCKKVYRENYTVDFPYSDQELIDVIGKKFVDADREFVESLEIVDEAKKQDIALLIYGSPLTATTHITLIQECIATGVKYKVIYNASIFDAIAETGLQLYKFGKTASMPKWDKKKHFTPDSFIDIIKENQSIEAHTLLLVDIGLEFPEALEQLKQASQNKQFKFGKLVICKELGTVRAHIFYKTLAELEKYEAIYKPYCIIIPAKLHFVEREILEGYS